MEVMEKLEKIIEPKKCLSRRCGIRSLYFREAVERVSLERELERVTRQNQFYKEAVNTLLVELRELISPDNAALTMFKDRLSSIPGFLDAYYFVSDGVINIWTIIEKEDIDAEMKIAEAQCDLLYIFQSLRFDFMVIPKYDQDVSGFLPSEAKKIE